MAEFVMPTLGADMNAGTLVAWKKKEGDRVTRGEIVAEVETDKAAIDVEIFSTGVIEKILVQPGEKVPVGTVLAIIREEGESPRAGQGEGKAEAEGVGKKEAGRIRISPSARQLARELGVDPAGVQGTGPDGAVTRHDIETAAQAIGESPAEPLAPSPLPIAPAADRQTRMRQAIAAAMARSKREIPHYYLSTTIDM
ncbi:MAG: E3 binding domain-containing protein, partial [Nitrospirae bacterium]|nr:E3 binding domain-containing protein [Nitrospirota bacterium]